MLCSADPQCLVDRLVQSLPLLLPALSYSRPNSFRTRSRSAGSYLRALAPRRSHRAIAYLSSFSIRSICVMIMRRQQYRLQPIWSMASLEWSETLDARPAKVNAPIRNAFFQEPHVGLPEVADDLAAGEAPDGNDHVEKAGGRTNESWIMRRRNDCNARDWSVVQMRRRCSKSCGERPETEVDLFPPQP